MKIGIDARLFGPVLGGGGLGRYVEELIRALAALESAHQFTLFVLPEVAARFAPPNKNWRLVTVQARWYTLAEQFELPRAFAHAALDLVHVPHFNVPLWCPVPFVATIHDLILFEIPTSARATTLDPLRYAFKRFGHQLSFHHIANHATAIITPSRATESSLLKRFPQARGKTTVIYEGVTSPDRALDRDSRRAGALADPHFLYVGSSYPHKNLSRLLIAFHHLVRKLPRARLTLVGKFDRWMAELELKARATGLKENVNFPGFLSVDELERAYASHDIFVFPSLLEGFGLPPLEALARGLPVLTSERGSLPEVLGKSARYVNPESEEQITRELFELAQNEALRAELRARGLEQAAQYTWARTAEQTLKLYERARHSSSSKRAG